MMSKSLDFNLVLLKHINWDDFRLWSLSILVTCVLQSNVNLVIVNFHTTFVWSWCISSITQTLTLILLFCKCRNPSLGLTTKARVHKCARQERSPRVWESVRMNIHTPKWIPILGVGVPVDSKTLKSDCKVQNPSPWGVLHIIGKLLNCRCPKWARMTHLDICNTSYGQKKGQESNWQFDSRPWEVRSRPNSLTCRWHATRCWKALDDGYNFNLNLVLIGGRHKKHICESRDKKPFVCHSHKVVQNILYGGRCWLPPSPGRGESCESEVACGSSKHQRCSDLVLTNLFVGFVHGYLSEWVAWHLS
jgi:hypothetical protein